MKSCYQCPKRYPACQDSCPEHLAEKAEVARMAELKRLAQAQYRAKTPKRFTSNVIKSPRRI